MIVVSKTQIFFFKSVKIQVINKMYQLGEVKY